jgi:hypothetical protein
MLKRVFPSALAAAVLGVGASGSSIPEFAQNLPPHCLPQEIQVGVLDGCSGTLTFGMSGPMVVPGQAPDIEATGSISRNVREDAVTGGNDRPE